MQIQTQQAVPSEFGWHSTADEVLAGIDLGGKLAIVTGGAGGIGLATTEALARAGAEVVIGTRDAGRLAVARERISATAPGAVAHGIALDLMSLDSIDEFADAVLALGRPVDILIANAGVIGKERYNALGIESGFMTNAAGHAALISRLAPAMAAAESARLVSLSSFGHHYCSVDLDDPNFRHRPFSSWASYGQSKTACVLIAVKVAGAMKNRGVDAFAVHPGGIFTDLGDELGPDEYDIAGQYNFIPDPSEMKSLEQGAATTIWAATARELAGLSPLYLEDCGIAPIVDDQRTRFGVMPYALDAQLADACWAKFEELLGRALPL